MFAIQYGINPLLMGLMVVNGAIAGGFSPISVFGSIVNGVVERNDLAENAMLLFVSSFVFNLGLSAIVFGIFGGRHLLERRVPVEPAAAGAGSPRGGPPPVAGGSGPVAGEGAVDKVAWSTVLLVCGIVTYVGLLENIGSIDWLGEHVADIGAALIAAMLICYVGGVVSAFASTTGILGALIPLAVPFLKNGSVGTVGLIIALSISSSVVDASPFSTSGALTVANSPQDRREFVFRGLMRWGFGWC